MATIHYGGEVITHLPDQIAENLRKLHQNLCQIDEYRWIPVPQQGISGLNQQPKVMHLLLGPGIPMWTESEVESFEDGLRQMTQALRELLEYISSGIGVDATPD